MFNEILEEKVHNRMAEIANLYLSPRVFFPKNYTFPVTYYLLLEDALEKFKSGQINDYYILDKKNLWNFDEGNVEGKIPADFIFYYKEVKHQMFNDNNMEDFRFQAIEDLLEKTGLLFDGVANDKNLTLKNYKEKICIEIVYMDLKDFGYKVVQQYHVDIKTTKWDVSWTDEIFIMESPWKVIERAINRMVELRNENRL